MRFVLGILLVACTASAGVGAARADEPTTVYVPGDGISLPVPIRQVQPAYTSEALDRHISGTVVLAAVVLADGGVGEVTVVRSLDREFGLDDQAQTAMKQWRFKPGEKDGKPVAVRVQVEMKFSTQ